MVEQSLDRECFKYRSDVFTISYRCLVFSSKVSSSWYSKVLMENVSLQIQYGENWLCVPQVIDSPNATFNTISVI